MGFEEMPSPVEAEKETPVEMEEEKREMTEDEMIKAVKEKIELNGEFQEIESILVSGGRVEEARDRIDIVKGKLETLMREYDSDSENSENERLAKGARLLLRGEVMRLYGMLPEIDEMKTRVRVLKESATICQESWKDEGQEEIMEDCEEALKICRKMKESPEERIKTVYQRWIEGRSIEKKLEEMLKEAKEKIEK